mmetsp:Transcript_29650/g.96918  ORF Transcript_29650/g.96918 Transcript_29650/m.96918 type:complete len:181 (+) Transcript_29650:2-544(+)
MAVSGRIVRALYAGSFDPPTKGHIDIISRALSSLCNELTVAVAVNPAKAPLFSLEDRLRLLRKTTSEFDNITITSFHGLLVDYAKENNINLLVRGLRAYSDFEGEFRMALINRRLSGIETAFLMADKDKEHVSSTLVRELAYFGKLLPDFVPESIHSDVEHKISELRSLRASKDGSEEAA